MHGAARRVDGDDDGDGDGDGELWASDAAPWPLAGVVRWRVEFNNNRQRNV